MILYCKLHNIYVGELGRGNHCPKCDDITAGKKDLMNKDRMLKFFKYDHLPEHLGKVSKPFCDLANWVVDTLPETPERTVTLRKLLEAKDAGVRTLLDAPVNLKQEQRYCIHGEPLGEDECYQTEEENEDE